MATPANFTVEDGRQPPAVTPSATIAAGALLPEHRQTVFSTFGAQRSGSKSLLSASTLHRAVMDISTPLPSRVRSYYEDASDQHRHSSGYISGNICELEERIARTQIDIQRLEGSLADVTLEIMSSAGRHRGRQSLLSPAGRYSSSDRNVSGT